AATRRASASISRCVNRADRKVTGTPSDPARPRTDAGTAPFQYTVSFRVSGAATTPAYPVPLAPCSRLAATLSLCCTANSSAQEWNPPGTAPVGAAERAGDFASAPAGVAHATVASAAALTAASAPRATMRRRSGGAAQRLIQFPTLIRPPDMICGLAGRPEGRYPTYVYVCRLHSIRQW